MTDDELLDWYRDALKQVQMNARWEIPSVARTLEWSLPFLKGVVAGTIPPVRPPPEKRTSRLRQSTRSEIGPNTLKLRRK